MTTSSISPPGEVRSSTPKAGLTLAALAALVVGSMIGSGVFALPSQMAASAAGDRTDVVANPPM